MITLQEILELIDADEQSAEIAVMAQYAKACIKFNESEALLEVLEGTDYEDQELRKQERIEKSLRRYENIMKQEFGWSYNVIQNILDWVYGECDTLLILNPLPHESIDAETELYQMATFSNVYSYQVRQRESDNGPAIYGKRFWNAEDAILWWNQNIVGL